MLDERYEVREQIGTGGMGAVYRAVQRGLDRPVALKVLRQHASWDRDTVKRFHREAKAMSLLQHPNTVRIFDFGETSDGTLYLAMEMLEGHMLTEAIRGAQLGVQDAVDITAQVLLSLQEAHDKGIIHRDLKPDNIFLTEDPTSREPIVKVLDFGIAKLVHGHSASLDSLETQAGTVFGTPKYMSPEQAQGSQLDARSDLYAVGALLYAMLTGSPPFDDEDAVVVMAKHIQDVPVTPRQRRPEAPIPPALDRVVMRALEKNPNRRFADASQFLDALAEASPAVREYATAGGVRRTLDRAFRRSRRVSWMSTLVGSIFLMGVGFFGMALWVRVRDPEAATTRPLEATDAAATVATGVPEPADVSPTMVHARLVSDPAGAEVWSEGVILGSTPLELDLPAGQGLEVELRLEGYEPASHVFAAIEREQAVTLARRRPRGTNRRPSTMRSRRSAYERFD